jgi:hypothetical protein
VPRLPVHQAAAPLPTAPSSLPLPLAKGSGMPNGSCMQGRGWRRCETTGTLCTSRGLAAARIKHDHHIVVTCLSYGVVGVLLLPRTRVVRPRIGRVRTRITYELIASPRFGWHIDRWPPWMGCGCGLAGGRVPLWPHTPGVCFDFSGLVTRLHTRARERDGTRIDWLLQSRRALSASCTVILQHIDGNPGQQ